MLQLLADEAYQLVATGLPMAGVLVLKERVGIGKAIDAILLAALASTADDWKDQVQYAP